MNFEFVKMLLCSLIFAPTAFGTVTTSLALGTKYICKTTPFVPMKGFVEDPHATVTIKFTAEANFPQPAKERKSGEIAQDIRSIEFMYNSENGKQVTFPQAIPKFSFLRGDLAGEGVFWAVSTFVLTLSERPRSEEEEKNWTVVHFIPDFYKWVHVSDWARKEDPLPVGGKPFNAYVYTMNYWKPAFPRQAVSVACSSESK